MRLIFRPTTGWAWWMALRWVRCPGQIFGSTIICLALGSMALAVAALLLTMGVMNGFQTHLAQKFRGMQPHLRIDASDWTPAMDAQIRTVVEAQPGVRAYPVIEGEVLLQVPGHEGSSDLAVRVWGVEPAMLTEFSAARWSFFTPGDAAADGDDPAAAPDVAGEAQTALQGDRLPGALVGSGVLANLNLLADDRVVRLTAPLGLLDPSGELRGVVRNFLVNGFFQTGVVVEDSQRVYLDRAAARRALGWQARTVWMLYTDATVPVEALAQQLRAALTATPAHVATWRELNAKLFAALRFEQRVMQAVLLCMMGLSCISIIGVVMTIVWGKQRQIAMLVACGAAPSALRRLVCAMGGLLGAGGALGGAGLALAVQWWLTRSPLALPSAFYLPTLPIAIAPLQILGAGVVTIAVAIACAWYPARLVVRMDVVQGLRAE